MIKGNMGIRRIRQFFRAFFLKMGPEDHALVDRSLDTAEKELFYSMAGPVQKHCVAVATSVLGMTGRLPASERGILVKAALLHDLGKSSGSFVLMDRVWYVLAKRAPYTLLHHEEIGAAMARRAGLHEKVVFLLQHHHNKDMALDSRELAILLKADELN